MNAAHLHLLVNHLPVVGEIFSVCLMLYGVIRKNLEVKRAALWAYVVTGISTFVANLTGDPAAQFIKPLHLVDAARISEHAHAADFALWSCALVGSLALIALLLTRGVPAIKAPKLMNTFIIASFAVSLFAVSVLVRVSELGGAIRHTEDSIPAVIDSSHHAVTAPLGK